ncbi:rRNA-processing protein EBP2 [Marasmius crinis-equi]|uniref:rRNA-processing protein EBP2 n=1 Tax=Marasmius crinis-equi TaxID=585013 RepID=A0ABR3ESM2_9AGAR
MSQTTQAPGTQFNVSTAVDDLKSRFMREWSREPTSEEAVIWNSANKDMTCWNCAQPKVECSPGASDTLPCTRCIMLNSQQICTRVIEERRARVKRVMNLDEDTFIALKAECFQGTRGPPQTQEHRPDTDTAELNRRPRAIDVPQVSGLSMTTIDHSVRQRSHSASDVRSGAYPTPAPRPPPSRNTIPTSVGPSPRTSSTPEVIDLTDDSDATVVPRDARLQSPRRSYTSSSRNRSYNHGEIRNTQDSAAIAHFRHTSYPPGSPFGVFASGHSTPPIIRHGAFISTPSGAPPTNRRSSFEGEMLGTLPRYVPPPPASAPAASMTPSFHSSSRLAPPLTAPPITSLHSPFTSPEHAQMAHYQDGVLTREARIRAVQLEADKIRQVTVMLAHRNQEAHAIYQQYQKQDTSIVPDQMGGGHFEPDKRDQSEVGGRTAEDIIARLQEELDKSRSVNRMLVQRNEELRRTQMDTDELRHAYRDLFQKSESLQRQQRSGTPVRMMRHMQLSSSEHDREAGVGDMEMDSESRSRQNQSREAGFVRKELDIALRELSSTKEALNDLMAQKHGTLSRFPGEQDGFAFKNRVDEGSQTRRVIAEHTNLQLLIRSLIQARSDFSGNRISKIDMLSVCDRVEKQLNQMAQRMLEGLPNEYERIIGALGPEHNGALAGTFVSTTGVFQGPGRSVLSPLRGPASPSNAVGPISPSSGSSGSGSPETRLKRRRIEDIATEESD